MKRKLGLVLLVLSLAGCGGGIDTQEELAGPPEPKDVAGAKCCPPSVPCNCPVYPG